MDRWMVMLGVLGCALGGCGEEVALDDDGDDVEVDASSGDPPWGPTGLHCGDGTRDDDELCDDGNQTEWDGCTTACWPTGNVAWARSFSQSNVEAVIGPDGAVTAVQTTMDGLTIERIDGQGEVAWATSVPTGEHYEQLAVGQGASGVLVAQRSEARLELGSVDVDGTYASQGFVDVSATTRIDELGQAEDGSIIVTGRDVDAAYVRAFDPSGQPQWSTPFPERTWTLMLDLRRVVAWGDDERLFVYELDANGEIVESLHTPTVEPAVDAVVLDDGGYAILERLDIDQQFVVLVGADGEVVSEVELDVDVDQGAARSAYHRLVLDPAGGMLVIGSTFDGDGLVTRVDRDGTIPWSTELTVEPWGTPAGARWVDGDLVIVSSSGVARLTP